MKHLVTLIFLLATVSLFAQPIVRNFATTNDSTVIPFDSAAGVHSNAVVLSYYGHGTNAEFRSDADNFNYGAANFIPFPNNQNSAAINLGEVGTNGAAIIDYTNDVGMAVDEGLWASAFGSGFGNNFVIDLYNRATAATNVIPGYIVRLSGKFQANGGFGGDGGFTAHDILILNRTNAFYEIRNLNNQPTFHDNLYSNGIENLVTASASESIAGTISASDNATPSTLTGSGTTFIGHVFVGDQLTVDAGSCWVIATNSNTSIKVYNTSGGSFGTGTVITAWHNPARFVGNNRSGYGSAITGDGQNWNFSSSGTTHNLVGSGNFLWSQAVGSSDGNYRVHDWKGNTDVFVIKQGVADSTLQLQPYGASFRGVLSNDQASAAISVAVAWSVQKTNFVNSLYATNTIFAPTNYANVVINTNDLVPGAVNTGPNARFSVSVPVLGVATLSAGFYGALMYSNAADGKIYTADNFSITAGILAADTVTNVLKLDEGNPNSLFWITNTVGGTQNISVQKINSTRVTAK